MTVKVHRFRDLVSWASRVPTEHLEKGLSQEIQEAIIALERLRRACQTLDTEIDMKDTNDVQCKTSLLEHMADEIIEKVLVYLDAHALSQTMLTCQRLERLCRRHVRREVDRLGSQRQYSNPLKLLRAEEHVRGHAPVGRGAVRVPVLLLPHRVHITNAGDPDFNGIYFCTGCNANGFVFTKPYLYHSKTSTFFRNTRDETFTAHRLHESELAPQPLMLRCVISKRFSNQALLWYLYKEEDIPGESTERSTVKTIFKYWANLTTSDQATPDVCRYPSQSSVLARTSGDSWHTLSSTNGGDAPQVELMGSTKRNTMDR